MAGGTERRTGRRSTAGAFDVRTVIALLFAIYGVVLVVMGLVGTTQEEILRADGFNLNLWSGLGMLVFAGLMQGWAWWRPIVVSEEEGGQ
ncbi:hypothetical protein [Salinifilum ghardaiensis]